ncbi:MAG: DUF835 domain-containing protein [Methanomassiliicoccales archaeon]|nr:MAG: DUF835 domain-containing protein [Methanomassiliicoccales archaeon]
MDRSVSPLLVVAFLVLALYCVPATVQAPPAPKSVLISTEKPDYFIGEQVQAMLVVTYAGAGQPPALDVQFEWLDPLGAMIFSQPASMTLYPADKYGAAFSNWTSIMIGQNFTVRGTHIDSSMSDESHFNVSTYDELAIVESLSLSISNTFYENNTVAKATATLGYLGNGAKLEDVSFEWRYPGSILAFSQNVTPPDGGLNGTVGVTNNWTVDTVGTDFEVEAIYRGVQPLNDIALFDVIPVRVKTWKNDSVTGNITWMASGSPYGVCGNITVQHGSRLTIKPGTVVKFCPDTGITVRGALVMEGLRNSNITLTSYSYPSSRGDWKGVTFEDESDDISSIVNYVIAEYSQQAFVLKSSSPTVLSVSISNSSISGIEVWQSEVLLSAVNVTDSKRGIYALNSTLDLVNSEIIRCEDGVILEDSNGTLEGNWFHRNLNRGMWLVRSSPLVRNNMVTFNMNRGVRVENSHDVLIERNTIGWSNFTFDSFQSTDLTLSDNSISNGFSVGLSFWTSTNVLVENSTISSSPTSFRVAGGSIVTSLNCTFDDTLVTVTGGSRLHVDYFLHVQVVTVEGSALEDASLTVVVDDVPMTLGRTGSDGWINWLVVRHETFSGLLDDPDVTTVLLQVSKEGYNITNNNRAVNMSASRTEVFEGYPVSTPPDGDGNDGEISAIMAVIAAAIVVLAVFLLLLWAIRRRKRAKEPEEAQKAPASELLEFKVEEGKAYIITQDGPNRSFGRFIYEMEKGSKGLLFTRTYPSNLEKKYDLTGAKVFWLSRDTEKGGLMPTNLGLITNEVEKFLKEHKDGRRVILLDGLEYLIAQNDFGKVLKLVNYLKDTIGTNRGSLLIPFNLKTVEDKEAAMLTSDLEVV